MKLQERTTPYRRYSTTNARQKYEGGFQKTLTTQALICFLLFLFCVLVKLYPNDALQTAKNGIALIVTHNTDIPAEFEKLKSYFQKDASLETLSPVSSLTPPASGKIIKGFGMQDASQSGFHYGVEVQTKENENIVAANNGKVTEIATNQEYGTYVIVQHSEEITTLYGGLNEILTRVGEQVEKGQPIARPGEKATFYFELRRGDTFLDPTEFIAFKE